MSADATFVLFENARPSDASEVARLYQQLVGDKNINVTENSILKLNDDESNFLIVGRWGETAVATALFTLCKDVMYDDQPFAILENIVVDSAFRGRGHGQALMDYLKNLGKEKRCTKIMLLSNAKRTDAHAFFEKCGYKGDTKKGFVNYINREQALQNADPTVLDSLKDFGTAYYFLMRVRILNAERLLKSIQQGKIRNGVLLELAYGYIQVAATEFALNLYDVIELFKKHDPKYKYASDGAVARVMSFRHNVVAHRRNNWGSDSSQRAQTALQEGATSIFRDSKGAIKEFCGALKQRGIPYGPGKTRPTAQLFRGPELESFLNGVPESSSFASTPSEDELLEFFGVAEVE